MIKTYTINRFAEVEGNNASGWYVINMVTGLAQETVYRTFTDARAAADHLKLHYGAIERGW
jgi:hypothetical protein